MSGVKTSIYIAPDLHEAVSEQADLERRSFSSMAEVLIEEGLARRAARVMREALERNRPYPAVPECPADTDNGGES